jgi:hypothetical protein
LRKGDFPLPYLGIRVSYANGTESANLSSPTLIPDIQTGLTFSEYMRSGCICHNDTLRVL